MDKFFLEETTLFSKEMTQILRSTVFIMPTWKWGVLFIAILLGFFIRPVLQFLIKKTKQHNPFVKKFPRSFLAFFFNLKIERPIAWIMVVLIWLMVGDALDLSGKFEIYYSHIMHGILALWLIQLLFAAVDALSSVFSMVAAQTEGTYGDQLVPFAAKTLKVLILVLGILFVIQSFGLNVMSLLAGLGLGGLALALAAQDTAANLFGSVTILVDHPFKIGDWVKIKDIEGTVEEIGFRSTRIRTFYNSMITIPNAMMAKETIDNMGVRPARRVRQVLGIAYETPPDRVEQFCTQLRYMIKQYPKVKADTVVVYFTNFNSSTLDILVTFHLEVFSGAEELEIQQTIFVDILKTAMTMKVDFAYPTQTVYNKETGLNLKQMNSPI
ncbi:MAG: mechanosensitive ion channel family protein [Pseudobdellovibrionaceae bacterium]